MKKLRILTLALFSHGFGQGLLFGPGNYETFSYAYYEGVNRAHFNLQGPVETLTQKQYLVNPEKNPIIQPLLYTRVNYHIPLRLYFNEQGYMIEMHGLGENDKVWEKYIYSYDQEGRYTGFYVLGLNSTEATEFESSMRIQEKFKRRFISNIEEEGIWQSINPDAEEIYRYYYDEQHRLVKIEIYDALAGTLIGRDLYVYKDTFLVEKVEEVFGEDNPDNACCYRKASYRVRTFEYDPNGNISRERVNGIVNVIYTYHSNGVIATKECLVESCYSIYPSADNVVSKRIPHLSKYDAFGRLIEERDQYRVVYEYKDSLGSELSHAYRYRTDEKGVEFLLTYCEYSAHDRYGNWTERRCTPSDFGNNYTVEELIEQMNLFRGILVTRTFTYYLDE